MPADEDIEARESALEAQQLLTVRDELVSTRAQLGAALADVARLEADVLRYERAAHELDQFRRSPAWKLYGPYQRARSKLGRRLRALLTRLR